MSAWFQTEIEIKIEMEEEFCAISESIKSEEERNVDIKPATLPKKYGVQRIGASSQYSEVTWQSNDDVPLSARCRLCAIPDNDMVDMLSSPETEDILEKISYSLPIMVTETDTLPKQICRFCLEELERCYRFHKTVAEADKQLHALDKLASMKLEETQRNDDFSLLCGEQRGPTKYNNFDASSRTAAIPEVAQTSHTTVKGNVPTASWRPCSVWLPITETFCENNSDAENDRRSSSDTECGNLRSTFEMENPNDFGLARIRNEGHKCNICAKTFKWKTNLTQHTKIHTNEGLYSCEYCEKKFVQRKFRDRHHNVHTNERPFKCSLCEKSFSNQSNLNRHAGVHSGERNYPCSLCYKSFKSSTNRKEHMVVHTRSKPWSCSYCTKSYPRQRDLGRHLRSCQKRS